MAGKARKGAFMGSDFAFEDLELAAAEGAKATLVSETAEAWVLDAVPGAGSSYGRLRLEVRRADYLPRKVEYFDTKGQPLKVLEVTEVTSDGGSPVPKVSVMRHLVRGTQTRLEVLEHREDVAPEEIPDETFTARFMEEQG